MPEDKYKNRIFTIPNLLSLLRILTVPFIVWSYVTLDNSRLAVALLAFGVVTDVADGFIARRFSMVSDLGKALDPAADKLTQAAIMICLLSQHKQMLALIILFAVKESYVSFCAWLALHYCRRVDSARWFGKLSTTVIYVSCGVLFVFPDLPLAAVDALIGLCFVLLTLSGVLYGRHYHGILRGALKSDPAIRKTVRRVVMALLALVWLAILGLCLYYRRLISVDSIVSYSPHSIPLAILLMLLLFALKSVSFVLYCGIFYAASGVLFPLPLAIAVNILGTAVMALFPYFLGRALGAEATDELLAKHPRVRRLRDLREGNDFLFVVLVRASRLSYDVVSLFMGAIGVPFKKYLPASVLGMIVPIVTYPLIGMSVSDPHSPMFRLSILAEIVLAAAAITVWQLYRRRHTKS